MFQAVYFQGLNWFQETIVTTLPEVKESIESIELTVPTIDPEGLIITYFDSVTPCFAETCESHYVLWMILGLNQGVFLVMFNLILIVYNGLRFYVTQEVNVLRDEEEMAGWSPTAIYPAFKTFTQLN